MVAAPSDSTVQLTTYTTTPRRPKTFIKMFQQAGRRSFARNSSPPGRPTDSYSTGPRARLGLFVFRCASVQRWRPTFQFLTLAGWMQTVRAHSLHLELRGRVGMSIFTRWTGLLATERCMLTGRKTPRISLSRPQEIHQTQRAQTDSALERFTQVVHHNTQTLK